MALAKFAEVRFPTDISFGSTFGPEFATDVVVLGDGTEQRNSKWSQARWKGDVHYGVKTVRQLQALLAFFAARRGAYQGFRFKHVLDYRAEGEWVGTGDGARFTFQLVKHYRSGSSTYTRIIRKPVGIGYPIGQLVDMAPVFFDGVQLTSGYALDFTTGIVVFESPVPSGVQISWSGEFDTAVNFATDRLTESLQVVRSYRTANIGEAVLGSPEYFALRDNTGGIWYYWFDSLGQLTRDVFAPGGAFVALTVGTPPSWHQVTDQLFAPWWLQPDTNGQLQPFTGPPAGSGLTFNTQAQDGLTAIGESGTQRFRLTSDTNGQPTLLASIFHEGQLVFDGIGLAEPIPILEVRGSGYAEEA